MPMQHGMDKQRNIFCEQRRIVTERNRLAIIREADVRECRFSKTPI